MCFRLIALRRTPSLWILLTISFAMGLGEAPSVSAEPSLYSYGETCKKALGAYRQGWSEILEYGRWTEAERLYREAVAVEPNCSIAKSVLARMTTDAAERKTLIAEIQSTIDSVDTSGRLILDPYLKTLLLIGARDTGESLGEDFRSDLTKMAISNYRSFLDRYPDEWAVCVEYVEWVHAAHGPQEALAKIREMVVNDPTDSYRFSYFPAYFYAELGDYEHAIKLAREFVQQLGPGDWPQEHYISAFIAYERGDFAEASVSIKRALLLDPKHLIAERLSTKIDTALATEYLPDAPEDG